jgi:V/A-type H+/Na+-transporting ATPase subunit E
MDDKISLLTQQLFEDGIKKAQIEGDVLLAKANADAAFIISKAHKDAEDTLKKAKAAALELQNNTQAEIKSASIQAIALVKQSITDLLTVNISDQIVKEATENRDVKIKLLLFAVDSFMKFHLNKSLSIILPADTEKDVHSWIEQALQQYINNDVKLELSPKIETGFRIKNHDDNYLISFTDDDFHSFFKHLIRPKTAEIITWLVVCQNCGLANTVS